MEAANAPETECDEERVRERCVWARPTTLFCGDDELRIPRTQLGTSSGNTRADEEEGKASASPPLLPAVIDREQERYPFCVVWTPIPWMTFLFPFIGHVGICDDTGYIYDFRGSRTVGGPRMLFWDLSQRHIPSLRPVQRQQSGCEDVNDAPCAGSASASANPLGTATASKEQDEDKHETARVWDEIAAYNASLAKVVTRYRQHEDYNLFTNNCHGMVAAALNAMRRREEEPKETVFSVMWKVMWHGKYVSCRRAVRHLLPPLVVPPFSL